MRRKVMMVLLGLGVVGGFGSEFARFHCAHRHYARERQRVIHDVAQECFNAAHLGGGGGGGAAGFRPEAR